MRVLSGLLLSVFAVTGPTACNDNNDKNTATLTVSTDDLVLGGEAGESETLRPPRGRPSPRAKASRSTRPRARVTLPSA